MNKVADMKLQQFRWLAGAGFAAVLAVPAVHAQAPYIWLDDKGLKQLSDQPPPPSVPPNRILRQPRNAAALELPAPADTGAAPPAEGGKAPDAPRSPKRPPTLAERNADFNKRRADSAAAAQKASQEASQKAAQASNCDNARKDQMALDSGARMRTFDKDGQQSYLSDEQRAERSKLNQAVLAGCSR